MLRTSTLLLLIGLLTAACSPRLPTTDPALDHPATTSASATGGEDQPGDPPPAGTDPAGDHAGEAPEATAPPRSAENPPLTAVLPYTSMMPPDGSLISFSGPDEDGLLLVRGAPGAVPLEGDHIAFGWVSLAAMETGTEACTRLNADGSFAAEIIAPPGTTLYLAPVNRERAPADPDEEGGLCRHNSHGDGMLMRVPGEPHPGQYSAYGALPGGRQRMDGKLNPYTIRQNYWNARTDFSGLDLTIRGLNPQACLQPALKIERLFDANGRPRAAFDSSFAGVPVTPTGLMVEARYYWLTAELIGLQSRDCLRGSSDYDLSFQLPDFRAGLPPGWYRVRLILGGWNADTQPFLAQNPFYSQEYEPGINDQGLLGPVFKLGDPQSPRLPWVLFAETASQAAGGARGIVALEMRQDFAFDSRVALTPPQMILPRLDPVSGMAIAYHLEPWLPSISGAPFRGFLPASPLIPLKLPGGRLSVSIHHPDGFVEQLGPAPFAQSVVARSGQSGEEFFSRPGASHSFAGPNRTYGLTTGDEQFVYVFPQDGLYAIEIEGEIEDIWGNLYHGGGSYPLWIGKALDIESAVFPGMPLMTGEGYASAVQVHPALPAEIELTIHYYPQSDPQRAIVHQLQGTANRYGYFQPAPDNFIFEEPGEYRVDILASFTAPEGDLWMAARSTASVVAEADTPLSLHGDTESPGRRWYFNNVAHNGCGEESCGGPNTNQFPVFRGDIVWFADSTNQQRPTIFLRDPQGVTTQSTGAKDMRPPRSWAASGLDVYQYPEEATVWEYWYESATRVGETIQQRVLQNETAHMHWYTSDNYNAQLGMDPEGDLPDDIKLLFGGAVHRGPQGNAYAYYAAMDVTIPALTDLGQRTCAPFQGAAGGPTNCGPILELHGRDVDLFLTPTGVRPGTILEVGDWFAFSGIMWPTLETRYSLTLTKPDGEQLEWQGQASPVGYVANVGQGLRVDQPGRYQVHLTLIHDAVVPSTGAAPNPAIIADGVTVLRQHGYADPLSAILGNLDSTFEFYVVERESPYLPLELSSPGDLRRPQSMLRAEIEVDAPDKTPVYATLAMPGLILAQIETQLLGGRAVILIDRQDLMNTYPNFSPRYEVYTLTVLVDQPARRQAAQLSLQGLEYWISGR